MGECPSPKAKVGMVATSGCKSSWHMFSLMMDFWWEQLEWAILPVGWFMFS